MLLFSALSFARVVAVYYLWLLLLSMVNRAEAEAGPVQKLVRLHLGWVDRWPWPLKLLLPLLLGSLAWLALHPLLVRMSLTPQAGCPPAPHRGRGGHRPERLPPVEVTSSPPCWRFTCSTATSMWASTRSGSHQHHRPPSAGPVATSCPSARAGWISWPSWKSSSCPGGAFRRACLTRLLPVPRRPAPPHPAAGRLTPHSRADARFAQDRQASPVRFRQPLGDDQAQAQPLSARAASVPTVLYGPHLRDLLREGGGLYTVQTEAARAAGAGPGPLIIAKRLTEIARGKPGDA